MQEKSQSGQATIEMVVMLLGIVVVMLGLLYVGGIVINSNRILLDARKNAQVNSKSSNSNDNENDIRSWIYSASNINGELNSSNGENSWNFNIPFNGNGVATSGDALTSDAYDSMTSSSYSRNNSYKWFENSNLYENISNQAKSARNAAQLYKASSSINSSIYNNIDSGHSHNVSREMQETFEKLFGVNFSNSTLKNLQTNQVYMPTIENE